MRRLLLCTALICALGLTGANAQTPVPTPPKPDLSAMKGFIGTWACTTTNTRRPGLSETATWSFASDDTGTWLIANLSVDPSKVHPVSYKANDHYTYDPNNKTWVDITVDNGGGYGVSTSPGPSGNVWVWHDLGLQKDPDFPSNGDTTVTLADPGSITFGSTYTYKDGKSYEFKGSCKRGA